MEKKNLAAEMVDNSPALVDLGDAVRLTNGDTGPKTEEGDNVVWGNLVVEENDPAI